MMIHELFIMYKNIKMFTVYYGDIIPVEYTK